MDDQPTAADLLNAWRDAVRAAELAERLAAAAAKTAEEADHRAVASSDLAELVEQAAAAATRAATSATAVAVQAAQLAQALRGAETAAKATELEAHGALQESQARVEESPLSN